MAKKPPRAKKQHEADPEPPPKPPIIMQLAAVKDWEIGPTKESDCALTLTLVVGKFEDVEAIRALARGTVVLHILPMQMRLEDALTAEACAHPSTMEFGNRSVCLACGLMLDTPADDQPKTPTGEPGTPMVLYCGTHRDQALDEACACPLCAQA